MEQLRSRSSNLEHPDQLLKVIRSRDGSNETRARLWQEIQKRIRRIDLHFDEDGFKAIADVQFINWVVRGLAFTDKATLVIRGEGTI